MSVLPKIPGYQVLKRLGAGGMGVVYSATREDTDYTYAIKMLLVGRDASIEDVARFRVEAEAYACLNHRCIIKIRDVGIASGCPYVAMDYAENGSIKDYVRNNPRLGIEWRVQAIRQVADALWHAHGRRMYHRDLKPDNILISSDESPRVTDFGLVKFSAPVSQVSESCCTFSVSELDLHLLQINSENKWLLPVDKGFPAKETLVKKLSTKCAQRSGISTETFNLDEIQEFVDQSINGRGNSDELSDLLDEMTRSGSILGSPKFISPEQALGQVDKIGPHTDVYGLGASLYYLLTGQAPIAGTGVLELIRNTPRVAPVFPSRLNVDISENLSLVVMKSLEKEIENRYPNMEMFGEDLDRVLCGKVPLAKLHAHKLANNKSKTLASCDTGSTDSTILLSDLPDTSSDVTAPD